MIHIWSYGLLILLLGCTSSGKKNVVASIKNDLTTSTLPNNIPFLENIFSDSIKAAGLDIQHCAILYLEDALFSSLQEEYEFHSIEEQFIKKVKLNNGYFGITIGYYSGFFRIATYRSLNKTWKQESCDSIKVFGGSFTSIKSDVNFDGYKDIIIDNYPIGVYGNHGPFVFLFDSIAQTYVRHTEAELENLSIDQENKQLRSRHYSSIYGGNWKGLYTWEKDSLVLLGEAVIQTTKDEKTEIHWTEIHNGLLKSNSLSYKDPERAWSFFQNKLLWQGEWEID